MFDIGWAEMGVIALVTLVVMGPKELPNALRTFAYWVKKVRGLAREFQSGVDQLIREAELDEAKKKLQAAASLNVNREIQKVVDPERALDKALALPAEEKAADRTAAAQTAEAKPEPAKPETVEAAAAPSAEVKQFPIPGAPAGSATGSSSLRPNGTTVADGSAGVAIGVAKPAPAVTQGDGGQGEKAPSLKAQSG